MPLLDEIPYSLYAHLLERTDGWALRVASHINLRCVSEKNAAFEVLDTLNRKGYSAKRFYKLLDDCQVRRDTSSLLPSIPARPSLKVAILIGNCCYESWDNLVTPVSDCTVLGDILKAMGFIVILLKNVKTDQFKQSIEKLCAVIPPKSFILIYFAGHGFQLHKENYMLGTDCPSGKYTIRNGVSENFLTKHVFRSKPTLFILLLDMCRKPPDKLRNPEIYLTVPESEVIEVSQIPYQIIGYATSPFMSSFEKNGVSQSQHDCCEGGGEGSCSSRSEGPPGISLYVRHLRKHLHKQEDFVTILELVHKGFSDEQCGETVLQKPEKSDNLSCKLYLHSKADGDVESETAIMVTIINLHQQGVPVAALIKESGS